MRLKIIIDETNGIPTSKPDIKDYRIEIPCHECGSDNKRITSMVMKNHKPEDTTIREAHILRCEDCNSYLCALPKEMSREDAMNYEMPFGKHKGKPLKEVPESYLNWILTKHEFSGMHRKIKLIRSNN